MRLFGGDRVINMVSALGLDENTPINAKILSGSIEHAQKRIEVMNFERRKNVLTYDDVMNQQRTIIYGQRNEVLLEDNISDKIRNMIIRSVSETFDFCFAGDEPENWRFDEFKNHYVNLLTDGKGFVYTDEELHALDKEALKQELTDRAIAIYESKDALFAATEGLPENAMREVEKVILLRNVDKKWMDHLEVMDELKETVGLNAYAQRDPVTVFRIESGDIFDQMVDDIKEDTVREVLAVRPRQKPIKREQVAKPILAGPIGEKGKVVRQPVTVKKVGRNDPCPCGSGKKYKKCCGANEV